jgi:leader peptidase (prepilin peptidase)/N-methyltransferase
VELLTAVLFAVIWWLFPPQVVIFLWVMAAILVSVTFIDAEHLIIPTAMTWVGSAVGLAACAVWPQLPVMGGTAGSRLSGLMHGGIGWVLGFVGLWIIVELGKKAFGKKEMKFETPVEWHLKEPDNDTDPMCFVIDGEEIPWWDLFCRKTDKLFVESGNIRVDGESVDAGKLTIREMEIDLPDGSTRHLSKMKSLDGTATSVVIPREAMGMGDIHLLGMVGAFFGGSGVFFALFSASIYAIVAAIIGRIGFGKQLPFGPFLAMGALTWGFGGWRIWAWYMDFLGPLWGW